MLPHNYNLIKAGKEICTKKHCKRWSEASRVLTFSMITGSCLRIREKKLAQRDLCNFFIEHGFDMQCWGLCYAYQPNSTGLGA